jgi:transmembrane sensor
METKINPEILLHFLEGKYSWSDYLKVRQWFSNSDDYRELEKIMAEQWCELLKTGHYLPGSSHELFEKIQYQILLEEKNNNRKRNLWYYYRQVAAFLLIPVLLFSILFYLFSKHPTEKKPETFAEIIAPEGSRVNFHLPDGSQGWLNSGSKLKYPVIFSSQRRVELTGEAYFDVVYLEKSDFVVSVPDFDIRVLGTKFDLAAYPEDRFTDVVLKEGKIEIKDKSGVINQTIQPNQKLTFNRECQKYQVKKVDPDLYSAWKEGYLVIDNEPLGQVVGELERWYNIQIVVVDEMLKNYHFKATFKDEPLEEVLRLIALTTPLKYTIEKRELNQEGVFIRKKVTLRLK